MRPRKKKFTKERIGACAQWSVEGSQYAGRWSQIFGRSAPLHIEIGCGKGNFAIELARVAPAINFVALERIPDVAVIALERVKESGLQNLKICVVDAAELLEIFAPDEVSRIYLNFSDPWPKSKHAKRRLTAPEFLSCYDKLLCQGGELHMKTDNRSLFEYSLRTLESVGFQLQNVTFDLHKDEIAPYPMTEYEQKFHTQGLPICRLEAITAKNTY